MKVLSENKFDLDLELVKRSRSNNFFQFLYTSIACLKALSSKKWFGCSKVMSKRKILIRGHFF